MLGQCVVGGTDPLRWGDGSDGNATWGDGTTKDISRGGLYQYKNLTIKANTRVQLRPGAIDCDTVNGDSTGGQVFDQADLDHINNVKGSPKNTGSMTTGHDGDFQLGSNIVANTKFRASTVIFATGKVVIEDDVIINASEGTNRWRFYTTNTNDYIWNSGANAPYNHTNNGAHNAANPNSVVPFSGGGGGGAGGGNGTSQGGGAGSNGFLRFTTNNGLNYTGNKLFATGTNGTSFKCDGGNGGLQKKNSAGGFGNNTVFAGSHGTDSMTDGNAYRAWANENVADAKLKNQFTYTMKGFFKNPNTGQITTRDDYPVVCGGDGGRGGLQNNNSGLEGNRGRPGHGAGMIQIIAPRIQIGERVLLYARGQTRGTTKSANSLNLHTPSEAGFGGTKTAGDTSLNTTNGMNSIRSGDGGSGAAGAGGGGFVCLVYSKLIGTPTIRTYGGMGGSCNSGGNRGGLGGAGAHGCFLLGKRNVGFGPITWEYEGSTGMAFRNSGWKYINLSGGQGFHEQGTNVHFSESYVDAIPANIPANSHY